MSVELPYRDTIYIPMYTEIYMEHDTWKLQLTPTISVRNTSLKDTIYIEEIDHYNSQGELVHQYHDNILFLGPLQSIEYVVAERERIRSDDRWQFHYHMGCEQFKSKANFPRYHDFISWTTRDFVFN